MTARAIIVTRRLRALIAGSALSPLFDRRDKRRGVGERRLFELVQLATGLADQKRWRSREAAVVGGLGVGRDAAGERRVAASGFPGVEVEAWHLPCEFVQIALRHITGVLFALLVVEELDVLPHLALLAGRERRDLLRAERFGFARGRLERAEFDLEDAGSHVVLDQRLKGAFGEGLADGALQVAEVLHRDRSVLASQCIAALGDAADEAGDGVDGGVPFGCLRREAMR